MSTDCASEVTRHGLHDSAWWVLNQGGRYVNDHIAVAYVLYPVADREPATQPYLVTVLASAAQPATARLDRSGCQRCRCCSAGPPGRPGELGQGRLGRHTTTRTTHAREWSTALALALIQALLGQRPVAQANRQKCALAISPSLEPSGMAQRVKSPGTQIDRDQRACGPMATSSASWYQRVP
jgi:hypothetical protein